MKAAVVWIGLIGLIVLLGLDAAHAQVVALGASNTYGAGRGRASGGVPTSQAYPAQLEAMLRQRGLQVRVTNAGVPGDTTAGMLSRLASAVPDGTRVVILQPGGNDLRRGGSRAEVRANVAQITDRLKARGISVILLPRILASVPAETRDPDGQHINARGHQIIAARLLPRVMAALRGSRRR